MNFSLCYQQTMTSNTWQYQQLLQRFIDVCWHEQPAAYAAGLYQLHVKEIHTSVV